MADLRIDVSDETKARATTDPTEKVECVVTNDDGIFKRKKHWPQGSTILLDSDTAQNFINNGDVEEVNADS